MRKIDVMQQVRKIVKEDRFKSQSKYSIKRGDTSFVVKGISLR
jgi:hypothetical protein